MTLSITACDSNSRLAEDSITAGNDPVNPVPTENPPQSSSNEFTLEATSSSSNIELEATNQNTVESLTFNATSSNRMNVTGNLTVSTGFQPPATNLQQVNPVYLAYHNMPQEISYDGYSTINYTLDGSSHSASLTVQQQNILDNLQQKLDEAVTYASGSTPSSTQQSISTAKKKGPDKSLKAMSEKEIKKMLKSHGYKVKKLGNRRFRVTRKYNPNTPKKGMRITSVFNAHTGKMEPGYTATKNGKLLSKNRSDKNENNGKRHDKSKIKRKNGDYLLLNITQKENQD